MLVWCVLFFLFLEQGVRKPLRAWMIMAVVYGFVYSAIVILDSLWLLLFVVAQTLFRRLNNMHPIAEVRADRARLRGVDQRGKALQVQV